MYCTLVSPTVDTLLKMVVLLLKILAVVELEGGETGGFFFLRVHHRSQMRFQNVPEELVQIPEHPQTHQSANCCCFQLLLGWRPLLFRSSECWSPLSNTSVLPSLTCGFVDSMLQRSKHRWLIIHMTPKGSPFIALAACLTSVGRSRDAKHSWYVYSQLQLLVC